MRKHTFELCRSGGRFNGLLPKSLFALSKAFFDKSKACQSIAEIPLSGLQVLSKLAFRAQTVESTDLPLSQDLFAKSALMTAQRDLGNNPLSFDTASFNIFVLLNLRIMESSVQSFAMINKIFSLSQNVRYVAIYRDGKLETRSKEGTAGAIGSESDRYEELGRCLGLFRERCRSCNRWFESKISY